MGILDILLGKDNSIYELVRDKNGKHQIGGDKPTDFEIPKNEFISNFQYLGYIDNNDKLFSWLPFRVNLICPIYLNIESVYLDYSNPNAPTIISPEDTGSVTTEYDDLNLNSVIVFEETKVNVELKTEIDEFNCIGVAGSPNWIQSDNTPRCPKSNKKMKFLCQLMSFGDVKSKFTNVKARDDYYQSYFDKMNFWGDGNLYIFVEPTQRTICCFIQNS